MSIEELCSHDSVTPYAESDTTDSTGGVVPSFPTAGKSLACFVQERNASEALDYAARGQKLSYKVYFSSDPKLSNNQHLMWGAIALRILAIKTGRRPGEPLLWIAMCETVTTRATSE